MMRYHEHSAMLKQTTDAFDQTRRRHAKEIEQKIERLNGKCILSVDGEMKELLQTIMALTYMEVGFETMREVLRNLVPDSDNGYGMPE